ncbi:pyruvate dehydrogenase [Atractiella rhizophila]|nr:pyruvate dehydrogenase [Atractiella rhizophila]
MLRLVPRRVAALRKELYARNAVRGFHSSQNAMALSKFSMPSMSPTMTEGGISQWKKKEGESFTAGDVLLEIETDKATMDVEAQDDGVVAKIIVDGGAKNVQVGSAIAILAEEGDEINASEVEALIKEAKSSAPSSEAPKKEEAPPAPEPEKPSPSKAESAPSQPAPSTSDKPADRIFASPVAKKIAQEKGIPLSQVKGTGPNGRIIKEDVVNFKPSAATSPSAAAAAPKSAPAPPPAAPADTYVDIPLSGMRKVIAQRLSESMQSTPHYYLTAEIKMDRIIKLREVFNNAAKEAGEGKKKEGVQGGLKLSVNDFIVKGAALALQDVPEVNSAWYGDFIRQHKKVDISMAVATPTGLITPIITNVGSKGLSTISSLSKSLAVKAREGKLQQHEYQGGTFTISNLGMFGSISHFTAIINPPSSCILAIGETERKVVEAEDEPSGFKAISVMKVTMSCDHRVVDGAVGARWMKSFKDYMENPLTFIL